MFLHDAFEELIFYDVPPLFFEIQQGTLQVQVVST